jgi:hypothetical protein
MRRDATVGCVPNLLREPLECLDGGVARCGQTPLLPSRCEVFQLNELAFEQRVEFLAFHIDLMGRFLNQ